MKNSEYVFAVDIGSSKIRTMVAGKGLNNTFNIKGFKEILEGKHDDLPESAFLFAGTIDEVVAKAKQGE